MTTETAEISDARLWIGGEWCDSAENVRFSTVNPATEKVICTVVHATADDVDTAVDAATKALHSAAWAGLKPAKRGRLLGKIGDLIYQHREELARLDCIDAGKPYHAVLHGDVPAAADAFHYFAGVPTKITGSTFPCDGRHLAYSLREPVGVVAAIIPWNFPLLMAAWKLAPALATGNTVVLKPAEQTPLSALRLAELCSEAGLPPGVVNVLTGLGHTTGAALVRHPGIHMVAFTGSTSVGHEIQRVAAEHFAQVTLELGGKSPQIVFADADLDAAAKAAVQGIFFNSGQVCTAGSRLLVADEVYEKMLTRVLARAQKLVPKDPFAQDCRLGPLISNEHLERVLGYIHSGIEGGARLLLGGDRPEGDGFFLNPTVFGEVDNDAPIAREEIFGPVLCAMRFRSEEQAIALANDTWAGLAAGVWTSDVHRAHRLVRGLQAGTVYVNTYNVFDPGVPYGGMKHSGLGRELSMHALEHYTQLKSVWFGL